MLITIGTGRVVGRARLRLNNAAVAEFEVATGAGLDVVHGIVGAVEIGLE